MRSGIATYMQAEWCSGACAFITKYSDLCLARWEGGYMDIWDVHVWVCYDDLLIIMLSSPSPFTHPSHIHMDQQRTPYPLKATLFSVYTEDMPSFNNGGDVKKIQRRNTDAVRKHHTQEDDELSDQDLTESEKERMISERWPIVYHHTNNYSCHYCYVQLFTRHQYLKMLCRIIAPPTVFWLLVIVYKNH